MNPFPWGDYKKFLRTRVQTSLVKKSEFECNQNDNTNVDKDKKTRWYYLIYLF